MFNKELFDKICKENGVAMVESDSPVLRIAGECVPLTRESIEHILAPTGISFLYCNRSNVKLKKCEYSYDLESEYYQMAG